MRQVTIRRLIRGWLVLVVVSMMPSLSSAQVSITNTRTTTINTTINSSANTGNVVISAGSVDEGEAETSVNITTVVNGEVVTDMYETHKGNSEIHIEQVVVADEAEVMEEVIVEKKVVEPEESAAVAIPEVDDEVLVEEQEETTSVVDEAESVEAEARDSVWSRVRQAIHIFINKLLALFS